MTTIAGEPDVPVSSSLLSPGQTPMGQVAVDPPPSDNPYEENHSHSRQPRNMDFSAMGTSSARHLAPGVLMSTSHSNLRSIAGSESRKSAYRRHTEFVPPHPVNIPGSIVHDEPLAMVSVPLDMSQLVVPLSDLNIDHRVHYIAPPHNDEGLGPVAIVTGMVTNDVRRYARFPRSRHVSKTIVPAMTFKFHDMDVPHGWTMLVYPEGARYFVNEVHRTFTEMNICDQEICDDIEYYMQYLRDELQRVVDDQNLDLDMQQVDLVVEPKVFDNDSVVCCYYFANHRDRCLFWLDDYDAQIILSHCSGVENLPHIQIAIQAQYWRHWDYFPNLCPVTQNLVDDVKDMLLHATCDHLTSTRSSAVFDVAELRDYLHVVENIKVYPPEERSMQRCHAAIVVGRIMYSISHNHFINFHGEDCARLNNDQSVHGWEYKPSLLMRALTLLLFFNPVIQVREMHRIFVDEIVYRSRWDAFISTFKGQLQDSNLLATVLLNVNVVFLAINSVDRGGRNITQMASYMSLVTSLASIVLGLVFVSRDRTSEQNTVAEVAKYLAGLHDQEHGFERLAIIYSLPKALLMWGIVFFFVAFSTDWWIPGDRESRVIVGVVTLVVFVMLLYGIIRTLDRGLTWWVIEKWLLSRFASAVEQFMMFMGMERGRGDATYEPQSDSEEVHSLQATNTSMYSTFHPRDMTGVIEPETSGAHDQVNHTKPSIHDGTYIPPSSDSHTNTGLPLGVGTLQQIPENTETTFQEQFVPAEVRFASDGNSGPADMHSTTSLDPAVHAKMYSGALSNKITSMSDSGGQTSCCCSVCSRARGRQHDVM